MSIAVMRTERHRPAQICFRGGEVTQSALRHSPQEEKLGRIQRGRRTRIPDFENRKSLPEIAEIDLRLGGRESRRDVFRINLQSIAEVFGSGVESLGLRVGRCEVEACSEVAGLQLDQAFKRCERPLRMPVMRVGEAEQQ